MKPYILALAVAVALFRPVLLFVDFNEHIDRTYQAIAHGLVLGLVGYWLGTYNLSGVWFTVKRLLYSAIRLDQSWEIRTASALTWVEIICAALSALRKFL
jgi:hypothetical protein